MEQFIVEKSMKSYHVGMKQGFIAGIIFSVVTYSFAKAVEKDMIQISLNPKNPTN